MPYISTNFATANGRLVKIKDSTNKVRFTIRPETVTASYLEDVNIKIKTNSDNRIITIDFTTIDEAKVGLTILRNAIKDALSNITALPGNAGVLGLPTDGVYAGESGIAAGDTVEDAFDRLEGLVIELTNRPNLISGVTFSGITFSGLEAGTGDYYDNIQSTLNITTTPFRQAGTVNLYLNNIQSGQLSTIGTNNSLTISNTESGLWKAWQAVIQNSTTGLTQIVLTQSNTSATTQIRVDQNIVPTISNHILEPYLTSSAITWRSGIPVLSTGDEVILNCVLNGIVSSHYKAFPLEISGMVENTNWAPYTTPNAFESIQIEEPIFIKSGVTGDLSVNLKLTNIFNIETTQTITRTPMWIDSVSIETNRIKNDLTAWDDQLDLTFTDELLLSEGKYQYPIGDWTGNYPIPGPNYNLATGDTRWVTFDFGLYTGKGVGFNILNINCETELIPTGITIEVMMSGYTGWLTSAAYPGWGTPINEPALVADLSEIVTNNILKRYFTFGEEYLTSNLYIKIGIDKNSGIEFSGIELI